MDDQPIEKSEIFPLEPLSDVDYIDPAGLPPLQHKKVTGGRESLLFYGYRCAIDLLFN